jgi:hypothetical protein
LKHPLNEDETMSQRDLVYCSECSRAVGEQVFGTAPRADVWILLEYDGVWGAKAIPESDLPEAIKQQMSAWGESIPNCKTLLIKNARRGEGVRLFVALSSERDPVLYRFELPDLDALLSVNMNALLRRDPRYDAHQHPDPLIAVCTNGRRDVSCAKYGLPVYRELAQYAPSWAWESTHLGGHRFAGTLVVLPDGLVYGHLDADDAKEIVQKTRDRYVVVEKMRGRSCYDAPAQAAEYYLRGITGERTLPGVALISVREQGEAAWSVRFEVLADGSRHEIHLKRELSAWTSYESSTDAAPRSFPQFHLGAHTPFRRKAPHCEG